MLLASIVFYAWGRLEHLVWLVVSILLNWAIAKIIARTSDVSTRKQWLVLGIGLNICLLGTLKYAKFILTNLSYIFPVPVVLPEVWLPLGISFFTIQQVMFLVDCYEGLVPASRLFDHATFVSFFPCVSSGPISRVRQLLTQIQRTQGPSAQTITGGLVLFAIGLFKKVVLADSFAQIVDLIFNHTKTLSGIQAWLATFAYTFQIYLDFSGYSDMAIGIGLMFGLVVPMNFDAPYRSCSIIEFWQRWHITLSKFITVYLYTPMIRCFKQVSLVKACIVTVLAMLIAGLWHGPSWTFVTFGFLHGLALSVNQVWRKKIKIKMPTILSWLVTFLFVSIAFVFFRSPDMMVAFETCGALLPHGNWFGTELDKVVGRYEIAQLTVLSAVGVLASFLGPTSSQLAQGLTLSRRSALAYASLLLVSFLFMNSTKGHDFIYFAF